MMFQCHGAPDCASTMVRVESEPVINTTVTTVMPKAASYEIIWAEDRTALISGYFDPEAHPASRMP